MGLGGKGNGKGEEKGAGTGKGGGKGKGSCWEMVRGGKGVDWVWVVLGRCRCSCKMSGWIREGRGRGGEVSL